MPKYTRRTLTEDEITNLRVALKFTVLKCNRSLKQHKQSMTELADVLEVREVVVHILEPRVW